MQKNGWLEVVSSDLSVGEELAHKLLQRRMWLFVGSISKAIRNKNVRPGTLLGTTLQLTCSERSKRTA